MFQYAFYKYCMFLCSDFGPLVEALGLYFQIRDDYANLMSEEVLSDSCISIPLCRD